ncbi:MAG: shikimate dehydrogenase, partial [Pseudomonadota bacterium]
MTLPQAKVIGWPIGHSRSPLIHQHWLGEYGIDGVYSAQDVAPDALASFVRTVGVGGLRGCNVTIPHKVSVMALADHVTPVARAIGAANT